MPKQIRKRPAASLKRPTVRLAPVRKRAAVGRKAVRKVVRKIVRKRASAVRQSPTPKRIEPEPVRKTTGLTWCRQSIECTICCSSADAGGAVKLACSHGWYCRYCVERYAQARLAEGAVDVSCPDCREPIPDHDLRSILTPDVISRFHERSISRAVASSSNLHTCPTPGCNMCYEVEDGDYWLRHCVKCKKDACLNCGAQPYHKGFTCQAYAAKMASRKQGTTASDASLMRWMRKTGTKQCPQCKAAISKEDLTTQGTQRKECHKMMCRDCMTKFCFKCLAILTDSYNCGCSIERHGFFNPITRKRNEHLKKAARRRAAGA